MGNLKTRTIVIILVLAGTALVARCIPLQWSSLPYNIDGLSEYRVVDDILYSEHLEFEPDSSQSESYVIDMPIMPLLTAFIASSLGVDPLKFIQVVSGLVGAISVTMLCLVVRERFRATSASTAAGVGLAMLGSFVYVTGCSWKETLGIMLIGMILYSYTRRDEPRFRAVLIVAMPMLVFVHHHSALLGLLLMSFWTIFEAGIRSSSRANRTSLDRLPDLPLLAMAWILIVVYYHLIDLPYLDYLSPQTDLYLYVAVAGAMILVGLKMARSSRRPSKLPIGLSVPIVGTVLMVYNYYNPIFPGIPAPSALIFVPFIAYLILVVPAWEGARIAFSLVMRGRPMLLSMILAPLSLITFAFLRAQDATSHMIIFRTFDFLMIGFAILVGLGFAHLVRGRPRAGIVGGICLVIICASTLPIAYNSQELFGVQNHTFDFEYDAVLWFSEHEVDKYSSDQRLGETGWRLFDIDYSRGLPYDLREGLALNASSFFVIEEQWSTNGAQEFPFGVVVVDEGTIDTLLAENSVFYVGGPADNNIIGFRSL